MASDATQLISDLRRGRQGAMDELLPLIYQELHSLAANLMQRERSGHTLQTTALVHEAYLRLVRQEKADWQDRAHFLAVAARAMRRVLVDHARQRNRDKRAGKHDKVPLDSAILGVDNTTCGIDVEALNNDLERLAAINPRAVQVVDMRFFAGMTVDEVAAVLDLSASTVEREWRYARAWLKTALTMEATS